MELFTYIADFLTFSLLRLEPTAQFTAATHFFLEDSIKILALVFLVVSLIAFVRTFLPVQKIHHLLTRQTYGLGYLLAALFGAVTPFCSCSSIPLFIGFLETGLPAGLAFTFLATSPLLNEVAFVILLQGFGWQIAGFYALGSIVLGILTGLLLQHFVRPQDLLPLPANSRIISKQNLPNTLKGRLRFAFTVGCNTFKKIWFYILLGVALGAYIHGYLPSDFFQTYLDPNSLWSVPLAVIIGVPIYAGCSTVAPVVISLASTGLPLGTALALMMGISGLSLPEAVLLKSVLSFRLILIFFGTLSLGIILLGYFMNFAQTYL